MNFSSFQFAIRHLNKNKVFSFINIMGLAVGIAASLIIFKYISFETSYDNFHEKADRIYRVQYEKISQDSHDKSAGLAAGAGPDLTTTYPEIEAFSKIWGTDHMSNVVEFSNQQFNMKELFYADDNFFEFFSFELLHGDRDKVLEDANALVISESEALRFFGRTDVVGETFELNNFWGNQKGEITGVFKDLPQNTHFQIEALISFKTLSKLSDGQADRTYGWNAFVTYLLLTPGTDVNALEAKFPQFTNEKYAELIARDVQPVLKLRPLKDIYLKSDVRFEVGPLGDHAAVRILALVSIMILILAYFNYINLATVKSLERAREIGVRKVNGAHRGNLIRQFLVESTVLNGLSIVLGFTLMQLSLPYLESVLNKPLPSGFVLEPSIILVLSGLLVVGSFFSGIYPALLLSKTETISALKGNATSKGSDSLVRKGLLILQFGIMALLLIGSLTVREQIDYMLNKDLGFDSEQVLVIKAPSSDDQFERLATLFKEEAIKSSNVVSAANSSIIPGLEIGWINNDVRIEGAADTEKRAIPFIGVDDKFISTLELEVIAGRTFNGVLATDHQSILLSREAVTRLGFRDLEASLSQNVILGGNRIGKVIGVVEDFHQQSMRLDYEPIIYRFAPEANGYFALRLSTADMKSELERIKAQYLEIFQNAPFDYFFLDEFYDRQFEKDMAFGKVINFFTLLAIWISGLGLIGLTSYVVLQKRKEIGIRKVLGAGVTQLMFLVSGRFLKIALLALVLFVPVSVFITRQWLQSYSFAIKPAFWIYALPAVMVILLTILTSCLLSLKSATANPVKALRNE